MAINGICTVATLPEVIKPMREVGKPGNEPDDVFSRIEYKIHDTGYNNSMEIVMTAYIKVAAVKYDRWVAVPWTEIENIFKEWTRRRKAIKGEESFTLQSLVDHGLFSLLLYKRRFYLAPSLEMVTKFIEATTYHKVLWSNKD